eukprot:1668983-Pyramimonas_sp.AAC.1
MGGYDVDLRTGTQEGRQRLRRPSGSASQPPATWPMAQQATPVEMHATIHAKTGTTRLEAFNSAL